MKTVLYYFSGTGNSLAVARKISSCLKNSQIVPMLKSNSLEHIDEDTGKVGLIYPIHINAVPRPVEQFISQIKGLANIPYSFAIATHGGLPGKAGVHLNRVLQKHGLSFNDYFQVEMVNNTPKGIAPKPLMRLNWELDITPDIIEKKLEHANTVVDRITHNLIKESSNFTDYLQANSGLGTFFMKQIWRMSERRKPKLQFLLDSSCTGCGICESVCTTRRIQIENQKARWVKEECNYCYACFNFCPVQAIGVKYYTKKLGRYHHPEIHPKDIAGQLQ